MMEYDIIIIGGGPAGSCAAIYALRAGKKVLVLEKEVMGGKIAFSPLIENYPGIEQIKGPELSDKLTEQVKQLGGKIVAQAVEKIEKTEEKIMVKTAQQIYWCSACILATGTQYRTLGLQNEEKFRGKGISFCAVCDGFFYQKKTVAVIGGGNTAVANATELANICKKVYVIQQLDHLTAEPMAIEQLAKKENVEYWYQATVTQLQGEEKLEQIQIQQGEKQISLPVDGMFLSIGQIPETTLAKEAGIALDEEGYMLVDESCQTNQAGIFAAGDCVKKQIRQLTTAVSDGTIAALSAVSYLENKEESSPKQ